MIRGVIFDLDGLLLDSEPYWERARREYSASQGCGWRHEDELGVKGLNSPEWAERILQRCGLEVSRDEVIRGVTERMKELYDEHLPLLPGATSIVRELEKSYPLGLASSSPPSLIEYALSRAGIRACFRVTVSADEVGKGKPSPDVFLVMAQRLGVHPHDIAVFEDSSAGINAGVAAGTHVIAVPNPHYPPSEEALTKVSIVLQSLEDFKPEMLERLRG